MLMQTLGHKASFTFTIVLRNLEFILIWVRILLTPKGSVLLKMDGAVPIDFSGDFLKMMAVCAPYFIVS